MTLGSWFRDYVYIPLGGNRVSKLKWIRNIFIVWFLTGFWHGAGWNFIVWGVMFAVLLLFEKIFFLGENAIFRCKKDKVEEVNVSKKNPSFLQKILQGCKQIPIRLYVIFFLLLSWMIFDASTLTEAFGRIKILLGFGQVDFVNQDTLYYLRNYAGVMLLGVIGCTPIVKMGIEKIKENTLGNKVINLLEPIVIIALLVLATAYLIDGSFNPFLYFRF